MLHSGRALTHRGWWRTNHERERKSGRKKLLKSEGEIERETETETETETEKERERVREQGKINREEVKKDNSTAKVEAKTREEKLQSRRTRK